MYGGVGNVIKVNCAKVPFGTFGRLTLFNTATYQELLDCNHSKAHDFIEEWEADVYG